MINDGGLGGRARQVRGICKAGVMAIPTRGRDRCSSSFLSSLSHADMPAVALRLVLARTPIAA